MKPIKSLYFLPAVICVLFITATFFSNVLYFTDYTMVILNLFVMLMAGVTLWNSKTWGAYLAIAYYAVASVRDYYMVYLPKVNLISTDIYIPVYNVFIPLIIYYIFCIVSVKKSQK